MTTPNDAPETTVPPEDLPAFQRTDLVSPGLRGLAERVLFGADEGKRLLIVIVALVAVCTGAYFAYAQFHGFAPKSDLQARFAVIVVVLGGQVSQSFFSRDWRRFPHPGYTCVNAVEFAALLAIITFLVTVPMTRGDAIYLLAYAGLALLVMLTGFFSTTRMRRLALMHAEQQVAASGVFETPNDPGTR